VGGEGNPRPELATSLMAGLGERRRESRFAMLPAVAMAAFVLVAGLGLAFGAMELRSLGHPSPTPPISLITPTPSPSPSPTTSASPSPTPAGVAPTSAPALASIQMVGPRLGWAVGSLAIFSTTDGIHWTRQFASTEDFVCVDFISSTTGWVVGGQTLLGTTDGGRTWHQLGEAAALIRSVHFVNAMQGWGIAGGNAPLIMHGVLIPI